MRIIKIFIGVVFVSVFFISSLSAYADDSASPTDCKRFYDEQSELSLKDFGDFNKVEKGDPRREKILALELALEKEGKITVTEERKRTFLLLSPVIEITNRVEECGPIDSRYYKDENNLCLEIIKNHGIKTMLDIIKDKSDWIKRDTSYCDAAFSRGDFDMYEKLFYDHAAGHGTERDYKKAIDFLNKGIEKNQDHPHRLGWLFFAAELYRQGGYGIEKNEKKAFKILTDVNKVEPGDHINCKLSLYYRDGIGTEADVNQAEKFLALFKEASPDKECSFDDLAFLVDQKKTDAQKLPLDNKTEK